MKTPLDLGLVVASAGAALALAKVRIQPEDLLNRHAALDFGEVDADEWQRNLDALANGGLVRSVYTLPTGDLLHVTTERSSTSITLPGE